MITKILKIILIFSTHRQPGFETKLLLRRIDGAIQVGSNVDLTFYSLVGSGRSGRDHHGSSLLENPYISYQCMVCYLSSTGLVFDMWFVPLNHLL
ncbi:unnamed protein product [Linum tenue]|uniref:Uncharacterized protein ycf68 n=1 Tax=Linum tenue TaxID=586396 RepID=A0AAV0MND6_9ROSI|nr:unnamed protein product [Linum tenue]